MSVNESREWYRKESDLASQNVEHVKELINQKYAGEVFVHVGIIYLAVGNSGGQSTSRYFLLLPYFNSEVHGYNFDIKQPFVFARGYAGTASSELYAWLDSEWTTAIAASDDNSELLECSPIMLCRIDAVESSDETSEFKCIPWIKSPRGDHTMVAKHSTVECWIHGPMDSPSMEKRLVKRIKEEHKETFMTLLNKNKEEELKILMESLMIYSNSFSFPTIQLEIGSPMAGLVPFHVEPVRLQIGGKIAAGSRDANTVHIPVARSHFVARRISFQRLWDVLIDSAYARSARVMREHIRNELQA